MANALDVIEVVVEMAMFGQKLLNVYHAVATDNTDDLELMDDITDILDTAYTAIENRQSDDLTAVGLTFKNLTQGVDIGTNSFPNYVGGSDNTNDPLPSGVALCITLPTAVLKSRGRKFLPGIAETGTTAGLFTSAVMTDAATMAATLATPVIGAATGSPIALGIVTALGLFRAYQSASASNVPAYQRRRKQGVGI